MLWVIVVIVVIDNWWFMSSVHPSYTPKLSTFYWCSFNEGSSSGIGRSIAQKFAIQGAMVVFTGQMKVELKMAVEEAVKNGTSSDKVFKSK